MSATNGSLSSARWPATKASELTPERLFAEPLRMKKRCGEGDTGSGEPDQFNGER